MTITRWIALLLGVAVSFSVTARADDVGYCKALAQAYERYVVKLDSGHTVQRGSTAASLALEQCRNGNTAGIPVLERELRNARIELPARS